MNREAIASELAKKLDPKHVKSRSQGGGSVQYVEGWHAIAEANRIFGWDGWTRETVEMRECRAPEQINGKWRVGFISKVRITADTEDAGPVVRDGWGYGSGIAGDLGDAYESAVKESETDAMKRALMTFGNPFGLALYDKKRENVGTDEPSLSQRAAPSGPRPSAEPAAAEPGEGGKVLSKAAGEAILLGIANCANKAALDQYVEALRAGPNSFAAHHPKVKVAVSQRYAELDPIPFGEQRVPEGVER